MVKEKSRISGWGVAYVSAAKRIVDGYISIFIYQEMMAQGRMS